MHIGTPRHEKKIIRSDYGEGGEMVEGFSREKKERGIRISKSLGVRGSVWAIEKQTNKQMTKL